MLQSLPAEQVSQLLVSIVMAVCNVDRFLVEAIDSVLHQTFTEFEFIIVDFGSTDKTRAIISEYAAKDNRIKFSIIRHCWLAEARNASCYLAQGRYVAIMDADDVSVPERLRWQVEFMEEHPEVSVLGGAVEWIDAAGRALVIRSNPIRDREIRVALLERCPFWQPSVIMRREVFVQVGGYRPSFAQAEDYDLWLRMAEQSEVANLRDVVLKYRIHPYQISMRKRREQTLGILAAQLSARIRKNGGSDPLNEVKEITPEVLAALGVSRSRQRSAYTSEYLQWIRHMCMAGEYSTALKAAHEILQSDLQDIEKWQVANLHLTVSGLLWRERRFLSSMLSAGRAVVTRPLVLGRPFRLLLRRLRNV